MLLMAAYCKHCNEKLRALRDVGTNEITAYVKASNVPYIPDGCDHEPRT